MRHIYLLNNQEVLWEGFFILLLLNTKLGIILYKSDYSHEKASYWGFTIWATSNARVLLVFWKLKTFFVAIVIERI